MRDTLRRCGIPVVAMQYPRVDLAPLRSMLDDDPEVLFVDNTENFERALQSCRPEDLFSDMFAVRFGHLTDRGNRLIAENLAERILDRFNFSTELGRTPPPIACRTPAPEGDAVDNARRADTAR